MLISFLVSVILSFPTWWVVAVSGVLGRRSVPELWA